MKSLIKNDGKSRIEDLRADTISEEAKIENTFYDDYKKARTNLFSDINKYNPELSSTLCLQKAQKLLDRFIFVCFAEDKFLIPENSFSKAVTFGKISYSENGVWEQVKGLFSSINAGNHKQDINRFNGGLFAFDSVLDNLILPDSTFDNIELLSKYDFNSDLNENILGHIFERSVSNLEEIRSEIEQTKIAKKEGVRNKQGIFYTPKYITKYIVENTMGPYLHRIKIELGYNSLPKLEGKDFLRASKKDQFTRNARTHIKFWESYRDIISNIKILDPACGSGAFLNEAFDYIYKVGMEINDRIAEIDQQVTFYDWNKAIIKNNIFGVDLNAESVEITKLSLWLKTANKNEPLTSLDDNIKCGNSVIDNNEIVGMDAFNWEAEFKDVFDQGGFDIIIGNPPYVSTKSIPENHRLYYWEKYSTLLVNEMDLYEIFLYEFSMNKLKPNGMLGMITPNTYFTNASFVNLRNFLLGNVSVKNIVDFPYRFFPFEDVNKETTIIILKNSTPINNEILLQSVDKEIVKSIKAFATHSFTSSEMVANQTIINEQNSQIVICSNPVVAKVLKCQQTFGAYLELHKGWMSIPRQTQTTINLYDKPMFTQREIDMDCELKECCCKCLEGRDIHRYYTDKINKYVNISNMDKRTTSWHFAPKIITQRIVGQNTNKIFATIDYGDNVICPNGNLVNLKNQDEDIRFFLGVLNSK